jgi:hypothetical protein
MSSSIPTIDELTRSIEDAQAEALPDQKSMDKLTLHYISNRTWAVELQKCYQQIEDVLATIDVLKATGDALDSLVSHFLSGGRIQGDYATGSITFIAQYPATSDIIIAAGTRCYAILESGDKVFFRTTVEGTITVGNIETDVACRAEDRGPGGNVSPFTVATLENWIPMVSSVENRLDIEGGTEDETDDELKERYFDAINAPGKATIMMLERSINDLSTISEVHVVSYGSGDIGVVVDYSEGIAESSDDIVDALIEGMAGGAQARGCLGATIDGSSVIITPDDVYGGIIWIRPRNHVLTEDTFSVTYLDMSAASKTITIVIPAGTRRGEMVAATMDTAGSRAKKILAVTPSGNNSYDVLMGMGSAGYLYNLPELFTIDIVAHIRVTDTPEADLVAHIEASLAAFLSSFRIGDRLEYSDVLRFFQNMYDATKDDCIGRPFIGIDEIVSLVVTGGDQSATTTGDRIVVEEDWRFEAGDITVNVDTS